MQGGGWEKEKKNKKRVQLGHEVGEEREERREEREGKGIRKGSLGM